MEICTNKESGQVFVHLDAVGKEKEPFITPNGIALILNIDLFSEPIKIKAERALADGVINRSQYNIFSDYNEL